MLMKIIRQRIDIIGDLEKSSNDPFTICENAAFNARKATEAIAFGCLVATENGLKHIPKDTKGHWNAEIIIKRLQSKNITTFPNPSVVEMPTEEDRKKNIGAIIAGVKEKSMTPDEYMELYQRLHRWLHEINPYVESDRIAFLEKHQAQLWEDVVKIKELVESHTIIISGEGFFCILKDNADGETKVTPIRKVSDS